MLEIRDEAHRPFESREFPGDLERPTLIVPEVRSRGRFLQLVEFGELPLDVKGTSLRRRDATGVP